LIHSTSTPFIGVLARCRRTGNAEVWLITAPVSSPHRAAYTPEIEAAYQELLAATGCRHIDCRDWMADGWFNRFAPSERRGWHRVYSTILAGIPFKPLEGERGRVNAAVEASGACQRPDLLDMPRPNSVFS
jgi:hypothetical protein